MSSRHDLKLDWCSFQAAKFAVERWHYSKTLPVPPMVHIGVWEHGEFVGCVLFARGATGHLLSPYGLQQVEGCELVRIALSKHKTPVSRIVRLSIILLRKKCSGLRLIVSFADPSKGHHGGVYQAGGWIYAGQSAPSSMYRDANGKLWHSRMISTSGRKKVFGKYRSVLRPDECQRIMLPGKHRYLMPLDDEMRGRIMSLARPYPKRVESAASGTTDLQSVRGGANPTSTLSSLIELDGGADATR
jgi:hypothetical protein